jgi:hypothetical protein
LKRLPVTLPVEDRSNWRWMWPVTVFGDLARQETQRRVDIATSTN